MKILHDIRKEYVTEGMNVEDLCENPWEQCIKWFNEIEKFKVEDVNAATLSTYNPKNKRVRGRIILVKEITKKGMVFFTNYESDKGNELATHPQAAITLYWPAVFRQIRCEGSVVKISEELSDKYFKSRPKESQAAAISSQQSKIIKDRKELEENFQKNLKSTALNRPKYWGGYELQADYWEFWQGRSHRLHDRICYRLQNSRDWMKERLAP